MSIHPEDAMSYADQLHRDLSRIAAALEKTNEILEGIASTEGALRVAQEGAWYMTTYPVQP